MFGSLVSKFTGSKNKEEADISIFYQEENIDEIKDESLDIPLIDDRLIREDEKNIITFVQIFI
jgi:hypothetical protein